VNSPSISKASTVCGAPRDRHPDAGHGGGRPAESRNGRTDSRREHPTEHRPNSNDPHRQPPPTASSALPSRGNTRRGFPSPPNAASEDEITARSPSCCASMPRWQSSTEIVRRSWLMAAGGTGSRIPLTCFAPVRRSNGHWAPPGVVNSALSHPSRMSSSVASLRHRSWSARMNCAALSGVPAPPVGRPNEYSAGGCPVA
jgi:hypothetical protein